MEIKITHEELQKKKLFLASPMFGGMCAGIYNRSISDLTAVCMKYGIEMKFYSLFNESLIPRARNYCVDEFLRSDSTHFLFVDADIGFNANDVIAMLAMQSDESPYDVLAGPYPKKCISWEKIKMAVDKGFADDDPENLNKYVGDYVFNPAGNTTHIQINEPAEVMETGTGFMMIRRKTFDLYKEAYPQYSYKPDHVRTDAFDGSREITAYFDCVIDPESKRYLSEDYFFCQNVRKMGGKVWLCPWIALQHVGSYIFGGTLADLAQLGASATADVSQLKKNKKITT